MLQFIPYFIPIDIISLKVFVTIVVLTLLVSFEHVLENSCNSKKAHTT